jgi:hypothetical protein
MTQECTGLTDKGAEDMDLLVQFVNCMDRKITSGAIKAEVIPLASIGDDNISIGGASASDGGSYAEEGKDDAPNENRIEVPTRTVICRNVTPSSFRSGDAGTVIIQAQLSRNGSDFLQLSPIQIICHEFTTVDLYPNFVPYQGKEVTVRGSGFFPADVIATIALVTPIQPVGTQAEVDASRKNSSSSSHHSSSGSAKAPAASGSAEEEDLDDRESLRSAESFAGDIHNPLLNVLTVKAQVLSSTEMTLLVPPIEDFLKEGYIFPGDLPLIVDAQVSFSLANDPANFLSKVGLELKYFKNGQITVNPVAMRRPTCDKSIISYVDPEVDVNSTITAITLRPENGWLRSVPNAAKIIISDEASGFMRTPPAEFVLSEDTGTYHVKCTLDISIPPVLSDVENQVSNSDEAALVDDKATELPVLADMTSIDFLSIQFLPDGTTPLEDSLICKMPLFNNIRVVGPVQPFPKDGATKGSAVTMTVQGVVETPSKQVKLRLRGTNDKYEEVRATIVGEVAADGSVNIAFTMPESLGEVAVNVKGKEKTVFVDISIDGVSFDKGASPVLPVKY